MGFFLRDQTKWITFHDSFSMTNSNGHWMANHSGATKGSTGVCSSCPDIVEKRKPVLDKWTLHLLLGLRNCELVLSWLKNSKVGLITITWATGFSNVHPQGNLTRIHLLLMGNWKINCSQLILGLTTPTIRCPEVRFLAQVMCPGLHFSLKGLMGNRNSILKWSKMTRRNVISRSRYNFVKIHFTKEMT